MEFIKLSNPDVNTKLSAKPGIYKILALGIGNKPLPIQRVCGNDPDGVLYIGQSTKQSIRKRVKSFINGITKGITKDSHPGAKTYVSSLKLYKKFPFDFLGVMYEPCSNAEQKEAKELKRYFDKYGELPPLNNKFKSELYKYKMKK